MSKSKKNTDATNSKSTLQNEDEVVNHFDQPDVWDVMDNADEAFWEEFFHLEDVLATTDELDPATFSISIENHQTGETKTFSKIHLKQTKSSLLC